ncbi:MAG: FAD-binding protein [Pseudomonadota bacterium]|nr:FAD-binding protein [Pseudomonadota bacterium]
MLLLLACVGTEADPVDPPAREWALGDEPVDTGGPDTGGTQDTGVTSDVVADGQWDVIVVGTGPAGAAAALTAREAGASVLLLEREDDPGLGLVTGGRAFAVGTPFQASAGVEDSVEAAVAEWPEITGVSGELPGVREFLAASADTLLWLTTFGLVVPHVAGERDAGLVPRVHALDWSETPTGNGTELLAHFDGELRTGVEVTAPLLEAGAVVGVRWTDLATGLEGASRAGAVVLATGGFLRDPDEVARVAPALAGRRIVYETNPTSDGGGLPFLRAVGAGSLGAENIGVYVHSIEDPWLPEGESLLGLGIEDGILVDATGARFANEDLQRSLDLYDVLPDGEIYAVLSDALADGLLFNRPYYNWSDPPEAEAVTLDEVAALAEDVFIADALEDAAVYAGVDAGGLVATVDAWNVNFEAGIPDPFGRDLAGAVPLTGDRWVLLRLSPGLAKNFGGVATDVEGHVLDAAGVPVPGLYAAGEVAGMLLGGGGGDGFSGSVNACFWGGRVAGAAAAGFAGVTDTSDTE